MAEFTHNIKITDVKLASTVSQYSQRAWTGTELRRTVGIQYYQIQFTLNYEIKNRWEVQSFIAQYQQGKPFTLPLGQLATYHGTEAGVVTATAIAPVGTMVINTNQNALRVGDMIQFSNHKKLYQIMETTGTQITVFPQLRQAVAVDEVINYNNLVIEARLDVDQNFENAIQSVTAVQFKATENL